MTPISLWVVVLLARAPLPVGNNFKLNKIFEQTAKDFGYPRLKAMSFSLDQDQEPAYVVSMTGPGFEHVEYRITVKDRRVEQFFLTNDNGNTPGVSVTKEQLSAARSLVDNYGNIYETLDLEKPPMMASFHKM